MAHYHYITMKNSVKFFPQKFPRKKILHTSQDGGAGEKQFNIFLLIPSAGGCTVGG
jgi:hypothetical protein